ncbi:hypothetical protein Hanom_Chr17g01577811 [Helianthus anomalus]
MLNPTSSTSDRQFNTYPREPMQTVRRVKSYSCSYLKKSNFMFKIPINFGEQRSTDALEPTGSIPYRQYNTLEANANYKMSKWVLLMFLF